MAITVNLYYTGKDGSACKFAQEMESSGITDFIPMNDPETVLLIDSWTDQEAIDKHHASEAMKKLAVLREKYDLHMKAERYTSLEKPASDEKYLRK